MAVSAILVECVKSPLAVISSHLVSKPPLGCVVKAHTRCVVKAHTRAFGRSPPSGVRFRLLGGFCLCHMVLTALAATTFPPPPKFLQNFSSSKFLLKNSSLGRYPLGGWSNSHSEGGPSRPFTLGACPLSRRWEGQCGRRPLGGLGWIREWSPTSPKGVRTQRANAHAIGERASGARTQERAGESARL